MIKTLICLVLTAASVAAQTPLDELYRWFHTHPELSYAERETSKRFAQELRAAGFEGTENVGGVGVGGGLRHGEGKAVLFRTDLHALPVKEETGLAFASKVTTKDDG